MIKKLYLIAFFTLFSCAAAVAQTTLDVNFNGLGFMDNREYKDFIDRSHTYNGTRTALDFGLNVDTTNHFVFGANALHEFGAQPFFLNVDPVAYFSHTGKDWLFDLGEFPREGTLSNYPRALLNDTLMYYRPNVQGILIGYHHPRLTETVWVDWVSRQTDVDREEFLYGFYGKWRPSLSGPFYISHYFVLLHDAGAAILTPDDHIMDNGGTQVKLGLDLTHKQRWLDSLSVEAGAMVTLQRTRGIDGWDTPTGFISSIYAGYRSFAILDEFYDGQPGSHILYGDSFYEKKFYNRLDLMWTPFRANGLKGQFIFSLHRTPGFTSNQEAFRVSYDLGRRKIAKFN